MAGRCVNCGSVSITRRPPAVMVRGAVNDAPYGASAMDFPGLFLGLSSVEKCR
jgi:hypothetical protein